MANTPIRLAPFELSPKRLKKSKILKRSAEQIKRE